MFISVRAFSRYMPVMNAEAGLAVQSCAAKRRSPGALPGACPAAWFHSAVASRR